MLSTFLLLAFLQREPKIVANNPVEQSFTDTTSRMWQLVPHHEPKIKLERPSKGYNIPLVHVATGAYKTYDTTSPVTRVDSDHTSNATTLYSAHGSEKEHLINIKVADEVLQKLTFTATALGETIKLSEAPEHHTAPAIVYQDYIPTAPFSHGDHVDHSFQEHAVLGELEAQLSPKQPTVDIDPVAKEKVNTGTISLKQPIPNEDIKKTPDWKKATILDESKLSQHLIVLEQAEEEFHRLHNALDATSAPINDYTNFGVAFCEGDNMRYCHEEGVPFDLALYSALSAAKLDLDIAEFNPAALVNGRIEADTNEAYVMKCLPRELREGFIVYLEHVYRLQRFTRQKEWKPQYRLDRDDAEFRDNIYLEALLKHDNPRRYIPYGRNAMIEEHWYRRGLDFEALKSAYWNAHRNHAEARDYYWLSLESAGRLNWHESIEYYEPFYTSYNLEIQDMERLPVEEVNCHPCYPTDMAFARAYESWEPREMFGQEVFPDCAEGDEAYSCLQEYQAERSRSVVEWQIEEEEKEWQRSCAKVMDDARRVKAEVMERHYGNVVQASSNKNSVSLEREASRAEWGNEWEDEDLDEDAMVNEFF